MPVTDLARPVAYAEQLPALRDRYAHLPANLDGVEVDRLIADRRTNKTPLLGHDPR